MSTTIAPSGRWPTNVTWPSAAAVTGAPRGAARSIASWKCGYVTPRNETGGSSGSALGPNGWVIAPLVGRLLQRRQLRHDLALVGGELRGLVVERRELVLGDARLRHHHVGERPRGEELRGVAFARLFEVRARRGRGLLARRRARTRRCGRARRWRRAGRR